MACVPSPSLTLRVPFDRREMRDENLGGSRFGVFMASLVELPKRLEEAGYVREFLAKVAAITPADGAVDPGKLAELTQAATPANAVARVFYMGQAVEQGDLEGVLGAELREELMREGVLVDAGDGQVKAMCAVVPARDF